MHQAARDPTASIALVKAISIVEAKERIHTKDWAAFERLYEYYRGPLSQRLMYLIGDREVVYDLYQDTFEHVWKALPTKDAIENFEAWLYQIARHIAIDYLRHIKRVVFLPLPESEPDEPREQTLSGLLSVPGHEELTCEIICITQALEEMSPKYRTCLLLQVMWGYSQLEIADSLEISESTVSANVSRGRAQLRTAYRNMMNAPNTRKGGQK